jgi:hypothetical protein
MAEVAGSAFSLPEPSNGSTLGFLREASAWTLPDPRFDKLLGNLRVGAAFGLPIDPPTPTPFDPVIGSWSPSVGSTVDRGDPIAFEVTDPDGNLARVIVTVEFPWGSEVIHNGDGFSPAYDDGSTRTAIANGYAFSLERDVGWGGPAMTIGIYAADTTGQEATPTSYAFTVSDPVLPDTIAPEVENVSPTEGTPIARTDPIFFDVTDDSGAFRRIIVAADFADGSSEVVHDGDNFTARYAQTSAREPIAGGFRYRVRRTGGWPYGPSVRAFAYDPSGNENA